MRIVYIASTFFLLFLFFSCKKKPSAGFGGQSTIILTAKHHGVVIDSINFFIKFNAKEAPVNPYDYTVKGIKGVAKIENLKTGDYYLYAEGWDPSIDDNVKGGIPFEITQEETYEITIPVTEKH